jgi:hypothetical protein
MTNFDIPVARFEEAQNLITAAAVGSTSATADAGCVRFDLGTKVMAPRFTLQVKVTNNATAPGASRTATLHYAFSSELITDLSATGAPLEFGGNGETTLAVALRNSANAVHRHHTALIDPRARYLYVWYDITILDLNARVTISADINLLG